MAYILLALLFLSGCFFDTSDDLPFGGQSSTGVEEKPETLFTADEVSTGKICPHDFAEGAACDPVLQNCGSEHYCDLIFDEQVKRARAVCIVLPTESLTGAQGDECLNYCSAGFRCSDGICKRLCELKSGFGCEEEQFCDDPFPGTHGVCSSACR